jgi:hypothetical protein
LDRWVLRRLGVHARRGYDATDVAGARRDVARGMPAASTVSFNPFALEISPVFKI